jgi:two-component system, OmpR family, response regulator
MKKVLVVDDTKNIRMILTKCLELEGYEVMTASDGKQALETFLTHNFDLAFLDIKLPEIRGTEVLKRIREQGIKTPVIIITAYATVKNAVECTNMGAVAYVQKPFSADKIRSVLKEMESNPTYEAEKARIEKFIADAKLSLMQNYHWISRNITRLWNLQKRHFHQN